MSFTEQFLARGGIYEERAICYRPFVCPSGSQSKTVEVRIMQFSLYSSPIPLVFVG